MLVRRAPLGRMRGLLRRLARETGGNAFIEFGFILPIVLGMGGYGVEISNLALVNLRVSHAALDLADNASRVGLMDAGTGLQQMREIDVADVMQGIRLEANSLKLTTYGRITLSSLEGGAGTPPAQTLHWQRCMGLVNKAGYSSNYGVAPTSDAGTVVTGMGDAGSIVTAPNGAGAMFVEINYDYQPLFGTLFVKATKIHYVASMIVRDNRNFATAVTNPSPVATKMTCDQFTA